jgi:hypothetical protein
MKTLRISLILIAACLHQAVCAEQTPAPAQQTLAPAQRVFETPIEAADALIADTKTGENAPLLEIFGTKHRDSISAVDPERDRELRARFAKMAEERRRFRFNDDGSVSIVVGYGAWPFPIPLVKTDAGWHFDTDAGILELLKRRIGENELTAIATLRAYVDAQRQYAAEPPTARKSASSRASSRAHPARKTASTGRPIQPRAKDPARAILTSKTQRPRTTATTSKYSRLKVPRPRQATTATSSTVASSAAMP